MALNRTIFERSMSDKRSEPPEFPLPGSQLRPSHVRLCNRCEKLQPEANVVEMRTVQFWVPDTRSATFAAGVRMQCLSLKGEAHEAEAMHFAEEVARHIEGWP